MTLFLFRASSAEGKLKDLEVIKGARTRQGSSCEIKEGVGLLRVNCRVTRRPSVSLVIIISQRLHRGAFAREKEEIELFLI